MKCSKCGTELEAGVSFCTVCGTPVAEPQADEEKTVLVNQDMMGQPQGFPTPAQPGFQQQGNTGFGQPMGQPQGNTGFGQPMGQPQGNTGYGQPMGQQPGMNPYGQPMGQQPGMNPYGQPMYNQAPKAPKQPRKPLSKKAKIGIISGAIAVVVLIVFFVVLLPILTRAKLKGEYIYTDSWDDEYTLIFDNGTYLCYDYDDDLVSAGTYKLKDNKVTLTDIEGSTETAKFDSDNNVVKLSGDKYKSTDKKAKIDFTLPENYLETIKEPVETAINKILEDEDIYDDVYWSSAYIDDDDLKDPTTDFEKKLATELNYTSDKALQTLMEEGYLEIDVYITYDGDVEISYYTY